MSAEGEFQLRPMLAARELSEANAHLLRFPLWGSYKLDGIRALVTEQGVVSRTLKPIRSTFVQNKFWSELQIGLDGELIYGSPTDKHVFNSTTSAVMTVGCEDPVHFYVFDLFWPYNAVQNSYASRMAIALSKINALPSSVKEYVHWVQQKQLGSWDAVLEFEQEAISQGYEGIILRDPNAPYKYGRSTFKEQKLLKLKRYLDSEAVVLDFVEKFKNENEAVIDALGYQKRSASKEGKIPANTLGTLVVRDIHTGVEFELGTGFDDYLRKYIWSNRDHFKGQIAKYKYFPIGEIDKPRQPVFLGWRDKEDL